MTPEILKLYEKLQPLFREKMGPVQDGDKYIGTIRLPLPIDPRNPERGLLGMCSPPVQLTPIYNPYQDNAIICWEATWSTEKCGEDRVVSVGADTPELALLKALAHQWEVEVK